MTEKVCIIGLGYIGLPTAAMFAKSGANVLGVDINQNAVDLLNEGKIHIEEIGLEELVKSVVAIGRLRASTKPEIADTYIIAVPTPHNSDNTANLNYVIQATKSIIPYISRGNTIIVESTIPPRTIDDIIAPILSDAGWIVGEEIFLAHCPERVLPGRILIELVENTRIIGGYNNESATKAAEVYKKFVTGEIIKTSAVTAEMSKLMENTFRDVNIALANELVKISSNLGINALDVIGLANRHPRVNLHQPGPGVGGHCLAVDPYFIIEKDPENSILISNSRSINNSMPEFVVDSLSKILPDSKSKVAVFGLTYKGNIDDVRESPAMEVISLLQKKGFDLTFFDPHVKQVQVNFSLSPLEDAVKESDCVLILTDHDEFKNLDENLLVASMKNSIVFDTKNCTKIKSSAIEYINFNNLFEYIKQKDLFEVN